MPAELHPKNLKRLLPVKGGRPASIRLFLPATDEAVAVGELAGSERHPEYRVIERLRDQVDLGEQAQMRVKPLVFLDEALDVMGREIRVNKNKK